MSPATIRPGLLAGIEMRNPVTTYRMCGKTYTWDELREVSKAEAAGLPPETWRDGKFDFNDYLIESALVGTLEEVDADDDYDDDD